MQGLTTRMDPEPVTRATAFHDVSHHIIKGEFHTCFFYVTDASGHSGRTAIASKHEFYRVFTKESLEEAK
jgi:hypothetical protein